MRRFLSWSWVVVPVAAFAVLVVLTTNSSGEPPSSTVPDPNPGMVYMPKPGVILSHNAVQPTSLRLGDINAKIVPASLDGAALVPPSNPLEIGWWGRMAGSKHGTTLLVGHTVSGVGGALGRLGDVPVGTVATVSGVRYRTVSNEPMLKSELAQKAAQLFKQTGDPRLVVVTCTGYNETTHEYSSNEVLIATPLP